MLQFPQELIMIWHTSQYVATAKIMQSKSFDWLTDLKKRMKRQRDFVQGLREHYQIDIHERYRDDLANLAQGVLMVMEQHKDSINRNNTFFAPLPSNKDTYNSMLDDVINFIEETRTFQYEPELPEEKMNFWGKAKCIYKYALRTFKK